MPEGDGFERFSVYGFSIDYPKKCRIEFNPKNRRESGDVVFHFPDRVKAYVSWGELDRSNVNFQTVDKHAEHNLENIRKARNIKNFENLGKDTVKVNTHKALYNLVRLEEISLGFFGRSRAISRKTCSVHLHCSASSRYFVVYVLFPGESAEAYGKTVLTMASSLKCH